MKLRHHWREVSDRDERVLERVESGETLDAIAQAFGVSQTRIRQIVWEVRRLRRIPDDPRDRVRTPRARSEAERFRDRLQLDFDRRRGEVIEVRPGP